MVDGEVRLPRLAAVDAALGIDGVDEISLYLARSATRRLRNRTPPGLRGSHDDARGPPCVLRQM